MGFEAEWLAARWPYDEAALDPVAINLIRGWGAELRPERAPVVVDLGSGTGAGICRVRRWLAPRKLVAYAVDTDPALLAQVAAHDGRDCAQGDDRGTLTILGDLLEPLSSRGGPVDGTVDLVIAHALADLVPLDRLASRASSLARPGGLVHVALAYDGRTSFSPVDDLDRNVNAELESTVISAFHRHMDRRAARVPTYGGSTAGRRLGAALSAAGLEILVDAESDWTVHASDGAAGTMVLARLLRYVLDAVSEIGGVPPADLEAWGLARRVALARRTLSVRVGHRDVLARVPVTRQNADSPIP